MGTILFISGQEIFVIMIVVLLLFGADKIPEFARAVGKGMRDFKKASDEIRREIESSTRDIRNEFNEVRNTVQTEVSDISDNIQKNIDETSNSFGNDFQEVANDFQSNVDEINRSAESVTDEFNYSSYDYHNYSDEPYQYSQSPQETASGYSSGSQQPGPESAPGQSVPPGGEPVTQADTPQQPDSQVP